MIIFVTFYSCDKLTVPRILFESLSSIPYLIFFIHSLDTQMAYLGQNAQYIYDITIIRFLFCHFSL